MRAWLTLLALLFAAAPLHAAVGRFVGLAEAAGRARAVVEGMVVATESADDPAWHRFVTRATVRVERAWRGAEGKVTVLLLGGEVGERVQLVPGEAELRPGERVLLFLEPIPGRAELRPVGMRQGVFRPVDEGGWRRDFDGLALIDPGEATARERLPDVLPMADLPVLLQAHPFDPSTVLPATAPPKVAP